MEDSTYKKTCELQRLPLNCSFCKCYEQYFRYFMETFPLCITTTTQPECRKLYCRKHLAMYRHMQANARTAHRANKCNSWISKLKIPLLKTNFYIMTTPSYFLVW